MDGDSEGSQSTEIFDGVIICTGHHMVPYWPQPWQGQAEFKGRIMHAHSYKDYRGNDDKIVAVVGSGNSGVDIAVELSKVAKQVYLITRSGTWIFNRVGDFGRPVDAFITSRFYAALRKSFPSFVEKITENQLTKRFDHELYGLKPKHCVFGSHLTINDELPNRIASGTVRIKPQIEAFTEHGLRFVDGTAVEHVDTVIVSTGYSIEIPFLEHGNLMNVHDNEIDAYQFIYPSALEHSTLGFIGLFQLDYGSINPIAEMQARVFCDVLSGASKLPSKAERAEHIKTTRERIRQKYTESRRHTMQVDYLPYMDELSALIGCTPPAWHSFLPSDPKLAFAAVFAPYTSYFYRLRGPHTWSGAREAILGVEDRIVQATDATARGSCFNAFRSQAVHDLVMYFVIAVLLIAALIH